MRKPKSWTRVGCVNQDLLAGPVHYRWMYPIERYLDDDIQTKFNEPARSLDGPIGDRVMTSLDPLTWEQAHRYVLFNSEAIKPFLKQHEEFVFSHNRQGSTRKWNKAEDQCLTFHE
ncbi:uncharacterized protein LOC114182350 isoform X2 [Vigna unguiculata]|uniref:uncharacterized protein LOC114182350 isoform X2 n=1 Tax=Vigna unguiculata TaxID=3917 RepID=UPI001016EB62|nr:uncharacterized protein LOC114182350 isoform X2 [Vigna unguiculata]